MIQPFAYIFIMPWNRKGYSILNIDIMTALGSIIFPPIFLNKVDEVFKISSHMVYHLKYIIHIINVYVNYCIFLLCKKLGCCKLTNEIKNSSLLAKFLNDKKSRIRCKFTKLTSFKHSEICSVHSI